jgi:hypothetical protein
MPPPDQSQSTRIRHALLSAFPGYADLEMMLHDWLDLSLANVASSSRPLPEVAFALVKWAEASGKMKALVCGAHAAQPGNDELRAVAGEFRCGDASPRSGAAENDAPAWQSIRILWREVYDLRDGADANAADVARAVNLLNETADVMSDHPALVARFRTTYGEDYRILCQKLVKNRYPTSRDGVTSAEALSPAAVDLFQKLEQP